MSKMGCKCGSVISNTLCPCPTEGWIVRDQDQDDYFESSSRDIATYFAAAQAGRRNEWLSEFFAPKVGADWCDADVIFAIMAHHKRRLFLSVAECEKCGRLHVQR